ncbi:MAG: ABC transporter permease [Pikeienuella sp.]|uniref:ABC transporter permease n=1 Tax=Pikeienuella sp. TaxID=2831957 RepID=UPI00391D69E7
MIGDCSDPAALEGAAWMLCYLTTPKHMNFYWSFLTVLGLLAVTVPFIMAFGLAGAFAKRARIAPVRWLGGLYTTMVRGVPDIVFFLFVPIALDQGIEYLRHRVLCPEMSGPVWVGNDFVVCAAAKAPLSTASAFVHDVYGFALAVVAYAIVFGAFAANVIDGALRAVPKGQVEAAEAVGMSPGQIRRRIVLPQMWVYALPGLSNLWMILVKATPLLFLLGIEDIVYWARELGGMKTQAFDYPHPDWRLWYFGALMIFYLLLTWVSQIGFGRLTAWASRGMAGAR